MPWVVCNYLLEGWALASRGVSLEVLEWLHLWLFVIMTRRHLLLLAQPVCAESSVQLEKRKSQGRREKAQLSWSVTMKQRDCVGLESELWRLTLGFLAWNTGVNRSCGDILTETSRGQWKKTNSAVCVPWGNFLHHSSHRNWLLPWSIGIYSPSYKIQGVSIIRDNAWFFILAPFGFLDILISNRKEFHRPGSMYCIKKMS